MKFNRTSGSFFRNEKLFVLNNPSIKPERSRNYQDFIQFYSKSSEKKSIINTYENINLNVSFRKEIKSLKDKRKQEYDNFHKNYLNEYYKRDFHIETENCNHVHITKKDKNFSRENKKFDTKTIMKANYKYSNLDKNDNDGVCLPVNYKDNFNIDKISNKIPNSNALYLANIINKTQTNDANINLNSKVGFINYDFNLDKKRIVNTVNNINAYNSIKQISSNSKYNNKTIDYNESTDYKDQKLEKNSLDKNDNKKNLFNNINNNLNTNTIGTIDSLNRKINKFSSNDYNINSLSERQIHSNKDKIFKDYFLNKKYKKGLSSIYKDSIKISSPNYTATTAVTKPKTQKPNQNKENSFNEQNYQELNKDHKTENLSPQLKNHLCQQKDLSTIIPTKETIELECEVSAYRNYLSKELNTNFENIEIKTLDKEIKTVSYDNYDFNNKINPQYNTSYLDDLSLDEYTDKRKIINTYETIQNKDSIGKETFDGNLNSIDNSRIKDTKDNQSTQIILSPSEKIKDKNVNLNSKKNNVLLKDVNKKISNGNKKIILSSLFDENENENSNGLKNNKKSQHVRYNVSKFSNGNNINSVSILNKNEIQMPNYYDCAYKESFIQKKYKNFNTIQNDISRNNHNRNLSCASMSDNNNDAYSEHPFQKLCKTPQHSSHLNSLQNSFSKDKFKKSKEALIGKAIKTLEKENDITDNSQYSAKDYINKYIKEKQNDIQKNFEKSEYYQQSQMIKSYNSTYENFNTLSTSSVPVSQEVCNLDKNFYYKPILSYSDSRGKDNIRSFIEKTKFLSKQNYLKTIQEERCVRIKEEFSNKIEEANLKIQDYKDYKKLFFEDFMQTLEKYTRFCIKQKDRERQELTRLINESNNSELELVKLKRQIEKLFQCFNTYSEYKRFLLCVKYRIRNSIFYEHFLKQGGNGKVKVEIKNAIFMDNLRKKNITRIKNLKKNNNNLDGRRNSIFCSSHRVKKNKSINLNLENQQSQDQVQNNINNNKPNKVIGFKEENNNSKQEFLNKNESKKDLKASLDFDSLKTNKKQEAKSKDNKINNEKEKINTNKDIRINKNMVLFKNLKLEGTAIKSIPIIEGNHNPMSSSRDFSSINSLLPSKKNSSNKTNNFKISSKDIINNESSSLEKSTSKNNLNDSPNKEYSSSNIISEFNPNKNILKNSDKKSKSRSVKNIINLNEVENKKNNNCEVVNKISDFSALLRSLKKLDDEEKAKKIIINKSSLKSKNSIINPQMSSNSSSSNLNSFAQNIINRSRIFSINSNRINNGNAQNHKAEDYFLRHYDKSLEFINGINNQNEDVKKLIIAKNSKGFMLVNKFFNPYNKSEKEKQNLLARMLEEYNTKNIEIFESVEEFNDILAEMQHRNLDLINIYNKNSIIVKDLYFRKLRLEKNNTLDANLISTNDKMEKQLNEQKQRNVELKAILKANEEKYQNLRVNESLYSRILKIFENLKVLKNKVNDNFIIYDDIHPNVNIYESLQIFKTTEKCVSFLFNKIDKYKSEEKYRIELNKALKSLEIEKKQKLALIEKEIKEEAKKKYYESYTDKCFRSEMNSNKRKIDIKYNLFEKTDKLNEKNKEDPKEKLYNQYLESLQEG